MKIPTIVTSPNLKLMSTVQKHDTEAKFKMEHSLPCHCKAVHRGRLCISPATQKKCVISAIHPKPYKLVTIKGNMCTATRLGHTVTRNVQRFKLLSKKRQSSYVQGDSVLDLEYIDLDDTFNGNPNSTDNSNAYAEN